MFSMLKLKSCSESQYIAIDRQVIPVISLESPLLERLQHEFVPQNVGNNVGV